MSIISNSAIFRHIATTLWNSNNLISSIKQKTSFAEFYWATKNNLLYVAIIIFDFLFCILFCVVSVSCICLLYWLLCCCYCIISYSVIVLLLYWLLCCMLLLYFVYVVCNVFLQQGRTAMLTVGGKIIIQSINQSTILL